MDVKAEMRAPCDFDTLFAWVEDLGRYPDWLEMVPRSVPADPHPDDPGPAWSVDLRGQLGPLARSKRLRMVRTVHESPRTVQFERLEHDGRNHSAWILRADLSRSDEEETLLTMHMHYGGALGGGILQNVLAQEIENSRPRLLELVTR